MIKREKRKFDISAVGYKKIKSSNLSKKKRKEIKKKGKEMRGRPSAFGGCRFTGCEKTRR